jgi:hypothetical protein
MKADTTFQYYIRLLTYPQALEVIEFFKDRVTECNITVGGLSVYGTESDFDELATWLAGLDWEYEITFKNPTQVTAEILTELKNGTYKK